MLTTLHQEKYFLPWPSFLQYVITSKSLRRISFGNLLKNIWQHYEDIAIARPAYDKWEYLPIYKLLDETVSPYSSNKSANPKMAGEVLEAVLYGRPYPASLINGVRQRIRADGEINRVRMAIIKGYYVSGGSSQGQDICEVRLASNTCSYFLSSIDWMKSSWVSLIF